MDIAVDMVRDEKSAESPTNNLLVVVAPDGTEISIQTVEWTAGQSNQTVTVSVTNLVPKMTGNGQQAYLIAKDLEGVAQGTNTITYVDIPNRLRIPFGLANV